MNYAPLDLNQPKTNSELDHKLILLYINHQGRLIQEVDVGECRESIDQILTFLGAVGHKEDHIWSTLEEMVEERLGIKIKLNELLKKTPNTFDETLYGSSS
jgi:hypothetical protein